MEQYKQQQQTFAQSVDFAEYSEEEEDEKNATKNIESLNERIEKWIEDQHNDELECVVCHQRADGGGG